MYEKLNEWGTKSRCSKQLEEDEEEERAAGDSWTQAPTQPGERLPGVDPAQAQRRRDRV